MSTDTKTRPPVWARKFKRWARKQKLNSGVVMIIRHDEMVRTAANPWRAELKDYDQSYVTWFIYDPETMMLSVRIKARMLTDTRIAYVDGNDGKVEYTQELWPKQFTATYELMELPPDIKRLLKERTLFMI